MPVPEKPPIANGLLQRAMIFLATLLLVMTLFRVFQPDFGKVEISYSDFKQRIAARQVAEVTLRGDRVFGSLDEDQQHYHRGTPTMNKLILETPLVSICEVNDCAYNLGSNCHARAITIGNGAHPGCDTFFSESHHIRKGEQIAGIGACKVSGCQFNEDFECMTTSIKVGMARSQASCMTYSPR